MCCISHRSERTIERLEWNFMVLRIVFPLKTCNRDYEQQRIVNFSLNKKNVISRCFGTCNVASYFDFTESAFFLKLITLILWLMLDWASSLHEVYMRRTLQVINIIWVGVCLFDPAGEIHHCKLIQWTLHRFITCGFNTTWLSQS